MTVIEVPISNHLIQNPLLLVTEPRTHDSITFASEYLANLNVFRYYYEVLLAVISDCNNCCILYI
jgi:hypothetical protein